SKMGKGSGVAVARAGPASLRRRYFLPLTFGSGAGTYWAMSAARSSGLRAARPAARFSLLTGLPANWAVYPSALAAFAIAILAVAAQVQRVTIAWVTAKTLSFVPAGFAASASARVSNIARWAGTSRASLLVSEAALFVRFSLIVVLLQRFGVREIRPLHSL